MKKFLFSAAVLAVSFFSAQKFEGGIKVGYVNSTLDYTFMGQNERLDAKHSAYMSLPVEYHLHKNFSLFAELGMAGLGGENLVFPDGQKTRLHFTTILIPVGVKIYPVERFALIGGYNFGFITNALGEQNGEDVDFEDLKNGNSSFSLGAEYRFRNGVASEVKYNIGTSNIAKTIPGMEMKNNFLQVGIGYYFNDSTL